MRVSKYFLILTTSLSKVGQMTVDVRQTVLNM